MAKDRAKTLTGLGITVVIFGLLMIILDAVAVSEASKFTAAPVTTFYYAGIWGGLLYLIAGVMGILAGVKRKNASLASFSIVTSIIAAIGGFVSSVILSWAAVACSLAGFISLFDITVGCSYTIYVLHSVSSSIAFITFIIVIILSTFSCSGGCGGGGQTAQTTVTMVYGNPAVQTQYGQPGVPMAQPQYGQTAAPVTTTYQY